MRITTAEEGRLLQRKKVKTEKGKRKRNPSFHSNKCLLCVHVCHLLGKQCERRNTWYPSTYIFS